MEALKTKQFHLFKFGFRTKSDLKRWFTKKDRAMLGKGWYYIVIDVPDSNCHIGRNQVMYSGRARKRISKVPIKEL